jgi:LysR family hca operon transcriptional activator
MGKRMELRHLRYLIAVAEEGSVTLAAERRLHTAQPSLSRQIRDLEQEVGVPLLTRSPGGIALTAAGRAFIGHARGGLNRGGRGGGAADGAPGVRAGLLDRLGDRLAARSLGDVARLETVPDRNK